MPASAPATLDYWRRFLQTSQYGIFETIENAILVAANDFPCEFMEKMDHLKETISKLLLQCESQSHHITSEKKERDQKREKEKNDGKVQSDSFYDDVVRGGREEGEKGKNESSNEGKMNAESSTASKIKAATGNINNYAESSCWSRDYWSKKNFESSIASKINAATGKSNNYAETSSWSRDYWSKKNFESSKGIKINPATNNSNNYAETSSWSKSYWSKKNFESRKWEGKTIVESGNDTNERIDSSGNNALAETSGGVSVAKLVADEVEVERETSGGVSVAKLVAEEVEVERETSGGVSVAKLPAEEVEVERDAWRKEREIDAAGEVVKIRDTLVRMKKQPDVVFDLLMRLEQMEISLYVLKVTGIAATVRSFKKNELNKFRQIRRLACSLIESWRNVVDMWVSDSNGSRANMDGARNKGGAKYLIGARPSFKKTQIQFSEGPSKAANPNLFFSGSTKDRAIPGLRSTMTDRQDKRSLPEKSELGSGSYNQIGGTSKWKNNIPPENKLRLGIQGPKLPPKRKPDHAKKMLEAPPPLAAENIEEDPVRKRLEIAKRKLQERLQKSKNVKRQHMGSEATDKDRPIGELLSLLRN